MTDLINNLDFEDSADKDKNDKTDTTKENSPESQRNNENNDRNIDNEIEIFRSVCEKLHPQREIVFDIKLFKKSFFKTKIDS